MLHEKKQKDLRNKFYPNIILHFSSSLLVRCYGVHQRLCSVVTVCIQDGSGKRKRDGLFVRSGEQGHRKCPQVLQV